MKAIILFLPRIIEVFCSTLSGLEALISTDKRSRNYKNDLSSHESRVLDRGVRGILVIWEGRSILDTRGGVKKSSPNFYIQVSSISTYYTAAKQAEWVSEPHTPKS